MKIKQIYEKCMAGKERTEYTIVGTRLGTFTMCPTKLYMDYHGPQEKKLPTHEFLLKKIEDGKIHEEDVCSQYDLQPIVFETLEKGFEESLKVMSKGSKLIHNPILFYLKEDLLGIPRRLNKCLTLFISSSSFFMVKHSYCLTPLLLICQGSPIKI
jgi:hypothetical protein